MKKIRVSFIIPHRNRTRMLVETIQSVMAQDCDTEQLEIILVTQDKEIANEVPEFSKVSNLKIIYRDLNDTISHLRNTGAAAANGEYLAFIDADIELSSNWVNEMLSVIEQSDYILIGGVQCNSANATAMEKIRTALSSSRKDSEVDFLPGPNLFMRRRDFKTSNGFPEHLATCEDYHFTNELSHRGRLYHSSRARFVHLGEDKSFAQMFAKEIWRSQSNIESMLERDFSIAEVPSLASPLLFTIMPVVALVCLLSGYAVYGVAALLTALLINAAYVLRLNRIAGGQIGLLDQFLFYSCYFPARAVGILQGSLKAAGFRG